MALNTLPGQWNGWQCCRKRAKWHTGKHTVACTVKPSQMIPCTHLTWFRTEPTGWGFLPYCQARGAAFKPNQPSAVLFSCLILRNESDSCPALDCLKNCIIQVTLPCVYDISEGFLVCWARVGSFSLLLNIPLCTFPEFMYFLCYWRAFAFPAGDYC